ncbi:hypothetical protein AOPFMNJM_0695 [Methylobacterium jeotgali]|uniref:Uncharacterized protein n=1 Tax=Methylobacterium jeotgali TaxID=381630 RepID=A0ABQ4SSC6_9HYPH|nr:hypothetical protein AOPFMNJM_0695 [Methylobacterium jeotgali]
MLLQPDLDRPVEAAGHVAVQRTPRRQLARLDAHELTVQADRGPQLRLRRAHVRAGACQTRLRLRHVRARHLADAEALAGLAELLLQHLDVVAAQLQRGGVGQHGHVGLDRAVEHGHLGRAQTLALAVDGGFRLPRSVVGLEAVEQGLVDGDASAARQRRLVDSGAREHAVELLHAEIGVDRDPRPVAGLGDRDVLVGGAKPRAAGVELGVRRVGADQGAVERLGGRGKRRAAEECEDAEPSPRRDSACRDHAKTVNRHA